MPLDPQLRELLDQMAELGPPINERPVEEVRAQAAMMAAMSTRPAQAPATEDRTIPGPGGDIPVRIYRPDVAGTLPLIVFFHGGGFVIGDIESHDPICQQFAAQVPAVVLSVDYRLAPEHPFPAPVEDCWAATVWAADHAAELGADASRVAVAGDSAGGNLSAVIARRARDAGGPPIAFQLLIYPATDMTRSFPSHKENGEGYLLTSDAIDWFMGHYFPEEASQVEPDASPHFVTDLSGLAPALIITAEFDPLRDEGEAYGEALRAAGVDAQVTRYDGMIHGFYGMDALIDGAKRANEDAISALRAALA